MVPASHQSLNSYSYTASLQISTQMPIDRYAKYWETSWLIGYFSSSLNQVSLEVNLNLFKAKLKGRCNSVPPLHMYWLFRYITKRVSTMEHDRFLANNLSYVKYLVSIHSVEYFPHIEHFPLKFINFSDLDMFTRGFHGMLASYTHGSN